MFISPEDLSTIPLKQLYKLVSLCDNIQELAEVWQFLTDGFAYHGPSYKLGVNSSQDLQRLQRAIDVRIEDLKKIELNKLVDWQQQLQSPHLEDLEALKKDGQEARVKENVRQKAKPNRTRRFY